jgi:hypothetical protein
MGNFRSKTTNAASSSSTAVHHNTPLTIGPILSSPETHRIPEELGNRDLALIEVSVPPERSRFQEQTGNQLFDLIEVSAPNGAKSGVPFAVTVNGKTVMVKCPPNVKPGQSFRVQVPVESHYHPLIAINVTRQTDGNPNGWMTCSG